MKHAPISSTRKIQLSVLSIALFCTLVPAVAVSPVGNLLDNPSFEETVREDGVPPGWDLYGNLDSTRTIDVIAESGDPNRKLVLISDENRNEEVGISQIVPATGGELYVATVVAHADAAGSGNGAFLQLRFLPSNEFHQTSLGAAEASRFNEITVGGEAPEGTTHARVYLYTHRAPTPRFLIDRVDLRRVDRLPRILTLGDPVPLEITQLKDLHLDTDIVCNGIPRAAIVIPSNGIYEKEVDEISDAIEQLTGVRPPIVTDDSPRAVVPIETNVIAIGNRSTNDFVCRLYDLYYTLLDLRYPGPSGYIVRTLHNPFGNGRNVVLVGGSDAKGIQAAARVFIEKAREAVKNGELVLDRLAEIRLGQGIEIPTDLREFETWEASKGYGSIGYFGWNSISKRMAMYYMTGDEFHAREAIRLAFPDDRAKKEIAEIDGERIENKDDPLGGPYHYNAHMMILFWDLIEESPVFTDEERMRVTHAFMRQLEHPGIRSAYRGPSMGDLAHVGSRHGQWTAISLYCLGRYFQKYYPEPLWDICVDNGARHFRSLHHHSWVSGENDNLFWYNTAIAPVFTYLTLTGDRVPIENGATDTLLQAQEILVSGREPDGALNSASLGFLHKAAYLTGDGRWTEYRRRTGVDVSEFRLGQSFWPEENLAPVQPTDLVGEWQIHRLPEPMWGSRNSGLSMEESFQFASCRTKPDAGGDFILLDGFNGASRNPHHTFAILELRLDGTTVLEGYRNQLRTRVDGMVEPVVAMDGALKHHQVLGDSLIAIGEVPKTAFANWKRSIVHRVGRYALMVDELVSRTNTENLEVEIKWETKGTGWQTDPKRENSLIGPGADRRPVVCIAEDVELNTEGAVATMSWTGPIKSGERKRFFSLVAIEPATGESDIECLPLGDNAAMLRVPDVTLAACGNRGGIKGELVLLSDNHLYGKGVTQVLDLVSADLPIEIDWDFASGRASIVCTSPTRVLLPSTDREIELPSGRHDVLDATPSAEALADCCESLSLLPEEAHERLTQQKKQPEPIPAVAIPSLNPSAEFSFTDSIVDLITIPSREGTQMCAAEGSRIHVLDIEGTEIRVMQTDSQIRMLRWWEEQRLLLAGCTDEKVIAFDEEGERVWEFVSEMDPAVFRAAKTYWFKSAPTHEGIHGLHTGVFLNGESQAFVGSACTLEILDRNGKLVRRMPQFWGKVSTMLLIPGPGESLNLLAARKYNGTNHVAVINNQTLDPAPRSFLSVPKGHTYMPGWSAMNRHHLFFEDFDGDGEKEVMSEINGVWNRVTVWNATGQAEYDANFGPGPSIHVKTMRDIDVADYDGDEVPEIVVATSGGMLVMLDGRCSKKWARRIESPVTVLGCMSPGNDIPPQIVLGCETGRAEIRDGSGSVLLAGGVQGRPMTIVSSPDGDEIHWFALGTDNGNVVVYPHQN